MADANDPEHYSVPDAIGDMWIFPPPIVWTAGLVIVAMAGFGLYQGLHTALTGGGAGAGSEEQANTGAVSAQAAQPLSANPQWSTSLNGPAMSSAPSAAPKAAPAAVAASDQPQDETDSSDQASAGPPTPSLSALAPPPAISAAPQVQVAPAPTRPPRAQTPRTPPARTTQPPPDDNLEPQ